MRIHHFAKSGGFILCERESDNPVGNKFGLFDTVVWND